MPTPASSSRNWPQAVDAAPRRRRKTRSTRSAGSSSCSPATFPPRARCVEHPSGWRLEAIDSDPRRIIRVRLHAPEAQSVDLVLREQLGRVGHRLELERIARGIEQEHRRLLARLPGEADGRLESRIPRSPLPDGPASARQSSIAQHQPEMRHRHVLAIDRIGRRAARAGSGAKMGDDLMTVQVEVDPVVGAAPLRAAEQVAIEARAPPRDRRPERRGGRAAGDMALPCRGTVSLVEAFVKARQRLALPRMKFVLYAFLAGAASAFAFEPVGAVAAAAGRLRDSVRTHLPRQSLGRGLLLGWAFGLGQFVVGLNWIATAFTYQAAMPAWLGWIAVVLLSIYLAIYPAMAAGLAWRFGRNDRVALVLTLAGAWAITEWLRGDDVHRLSLESGSARRSRPHLLISITA